MFLLLAYKRPSCLTPLAPAAPEPASSPPDWKCWQTEAPSYENPPHFSGKQKIALLCSGDILQKGPLPHFLDNNSIGRGNFWHFQWLQTDQHQRKGNRCGEPVPGTKERLRYLTFGVFNIPSVPMLNALLSSSYSARADPGTVDYQEAQGTRSFPHL